MSDLCPPEAVPAIGTETVKGGRRCAYVALGCVVSIQPWHVGEYGPELLTHVGEKGRFVQWALVAMDQVIGSLATWPAFMREVQGDSKVALDKLGAGKNQATHLARRHRPNTIRAYVDD